MIYSNGKNGKSAILSNFENCLGFFWSAAIKNFMRYSEKRNDIFFPI
jgi:hypothetical protein